MKVISLGSPPQKYEPAYRWVDREWVCEACSAVVVLESGDDVDMPTGYRTQVLVTCPTCQSLEWFRLRHLSLWQRFVKKVGVLK